MATVQNMAVYIMNWWPQPTIPLHWWIPTCGCSLTLNFHCESSVNYWPMGNRWWPTPLKPAGMAGLSTINKWLTNGWPTDQQRTWMLVERIVIPLVSLSTIDRWCPGKNWPLHCRWMLRDSNTFFDFVSDQCPALWRQTIIDVQMHQVHSNIMLWISS